MDDEQNIASKLPEGANLPPIPPSALLSNPPPPVPASASPSPSLPEAVTQEIPESAIPPTSPVMPAANEKSAGDEEKPQPDEGESSSIEQAVPEVMNGNEERAGVDEPKEEPVEHNQVAEQPQVVVLRQPFDQAQGDITQDDKVVEKIVPAEVTEADKDRIFHDKLVALSARGNAARIKRLADNHAKIIEYLKQHGYATNNEIEKICGVADSTATKYLKELEHEGLVVSIGKKGKNLRWRLKEGQS